jgi:hypothetical protein
MNGRASWFAEIPPFLATFHQSQFPMAQHHPH